MSLVVKLLALFVREIQAEIKRQEPSAVVVEDNNHIRYDPSSTVGGDFERAVGWDHDNRHPIGFKAPEEG